MSKAGATGRTLRIVGTKPTTIWRPAITPTIQKEREGQCELPLVVGFER